MPHKIGETRLLRYGKKRYGADFIHLENPGRVPVPHFLRRVQVTLNAAKLASARVGKGKQQLGQAPGVVARHAVLHQQVRAQGLDAQLAYGIEVQFDGRGALGGVTS